MFLGKELMYGKTGILRTRQMNAIAQQQLADLVTCKRRYASRRIIGWTTANY